MVPLRGWSTSRHGWSPARCTCEVRPEGLRAGVRPARCTCTCTCDFALPCSGERVSGRARRDWAFDLQRFGAEERTLPATRKRRERARTEGQLPHTPDLGAALGLFAAAIALSAAGPAAARGFLAWSADLLAASPASSLGVGDTMALVGAAGGAAMRLLVPVMVAIAVATVAAGVAQTGGVLSLHPLQPDFNRLNPVQGIGRLFSRRALVELLKAIVKAGGMIALLYGPVRGLLAGLTAGSMSLPAELALTYHTALTVLYRAAAVQLVAGGVDYAYKRWETEQAIRMTPREVRDELRETDGDPHMRARRRRRQRDLSRRRMLRDVSRADVVLTNPTHVAVALRYDPQTMPAPLCVAKGADFMAERVKAMARGAGVLVVDNPPLARALYGGVKVGQQIPSALYQAVAEVMAFVWRVQGRALPPADEAQGGTPRSVTGAGSEGGVGL